MKEDMKELEQEESKEVSGGSCSTGYCPYTTDRNCKIPSVGGFDPKNERCADCGWRAW